MRLFLLFIGVTFFLCNCGSTHNHAGNLRSKARQVLGLDSIYNYSKVEIANKKLSAANRKEGSKLFLQAVDMYRNRKKPGESIMIFKTAITYYPTGRMYYELGNALSDDKSYKEAITAYHMAQNTEYKPEANIYYNLACTEALNKDTGMAIQDLKDAIVAGYRNRKLYHGIGSEPERKVNYHTGGTPLFNPSFL